MGDLCWSIPSLMQSIGKHLMEYVADGMVKLMLVERFVEFFPNLLSSWVGASKEMKIYNQPYF